MNQSTKSILAGLVLTVSISGPLLAQQPTPTTAEGTMSRSGKTTGAPNKATNTSPRQGYTKPAAVGTNNGNAGNSIVPTSTQGSTSDGSASRASDGGGQGTQTRETRKPQPKAAMTAKTGTQPSAAAGGPQNPAARPGTAGDTRTTRSQQGAKANSATTAGITGARPGDGLNKAQTKTSMSPTAANGSSRNDQNSQGATVSTSGKTGARRPSTTAQVQKEAKTPDEMTSTGYPSPTGVGKPGTPSGNAKGKTGSAKAQSYSQPTKQ